LIDEENVMAKQNINEEVTIHPVRFFIRLFTLIVSLWLASEVATAFAPHLEHAQRWPLHIAF
jgi:hypothetical protein